MTDFDDTARFFSVKQVAQYLQVGEKKIYDLVAEGKLPGTKITGKWLFPRDLVDQWLHESSHGGVLTDRLIIAGSDDPLLHRVVSHLASEVGARALMSYGPTGTQLGLELLAARRIDVGAIHWGPVEESHVRHPALLSAYPQHHRWVLVRAFRREQGLIVAPERGLEERDVAGILTAKLRWGMRPSGAGSQRFLHEALAHHGVRLGDLDASAIAHCERETSSLVATGAADVAPGPRSAAREFGLGFVPIGWEGFDLALDQRIYFRTLFRNLLDALASARTRELAQSLGGYDLDELGKLVWAS